MDSDFGPSPWGTFGYSIAYTSADLDKHQRGWCACIPTPVTHWGCFWGSKFPDTSAPWACAQSGLLQPESCPPTGSHSAGCWECKRPEADVYGRQRDSRRYGWSTDSTHPVLCCLKHGHRHTHPSGLFEFPSSTLLYYPGSITITAVTPCFRIISSCVSVLHFTVTTLRIGIVFTVQCQAYNRYL